MDQSELTPARRRAMRKSAYKNKHFTKIAVWVPKEDARKFREKSRREKVPMSKVFRSAIDGYMGLERKSAHGNRMLYIVELDQLQPVPDLPKAEAPKRRTPVPESKPVKSAKRGKPSKAVKTPKSVKVDKLSKVAKRGRPKKR